MSENFYRVDLFPFYTSGPERSRIGVLGPKGLGPRRGDRRRLDPKRYGVTFYLVLVLVRPLVSLNLTPRDLKSFPAQS